MLNVTSFQLGQLQTNCYVASKGKEALAIDPGGDPSTVVAYLEKNDLTLKVILNTHLHFDHIQGNAALKQATGATIMVNNGDAFLLDLDIGGGEFMGFPKTEPFEFEGIESGETSFLGEQCQVLATPGHSPGSLSFYFPASKVVFSGDLIFHHSIGRTDFAGGDQNELLDSVRKNIFVLPDETVICSGHGPETTVGEEKAHNPFFNQGFFL